MKSSVDQLLGTGEPPDLGPGPRSGVQPRGVLERQLNELVKNAGLLPENQKLVRALILLWHDHLEAAHELAQAVENSDGAFVHGIMHRREPDYGNAKYWFRRVGNHAAFAPLAERARNILQAAGERQLEQALIGQGQWDPFGFVDACEHAAGTGTSDSQIRALRKIQRAEFEILLEHLA